MINGPEEQKDIIELGTEQTEQTGQTEHLNYYGSATVFEMVRT